MLPLPDYAFATPLSLPLPPPCSAIFIYAVIFAAMLSPQIAIIDCLLRHRCFFASMLIYAEAQILPLPLFAIVSFLICHFIFAFIADAADVSLRRCHAITFSSRNYYFAIADCHFFAFAITFAIIFAIIDADFRLPHYYASYSFHAVFIYC